MNDPLMLLRGLEIMLGRLEKISLPLAHFEHHVSQLDFSPDPGLPADSRGAG